MKDNLYAHIYFSVILAIISVIFSIVALCNTCPRLIKKDDFGFDYLGVIVGILALLVTVLIGWNIFSALGIQKEIKDMKKSMGEEYDRLNKRMDAFEKKSDEKIDELKSEKGIVRLSHTTIVIGKDKGSASFSVESNTDWNIIVGNGIYPIAGLRVFPLNGSGDANISIEYDGVDSAVYDQSAFITVHYKSFGERMFEAVNIYRRSMLKTTFVIPGEDKDSFAKADSDLQNLLLDYMIRREVNLVTREYRVFLKSEPSKEVTSRITEILGSEPKYEAV